MVEPEIVELYSLLRQHTLALLELSRLERWDQVAAQAAAQAAVVEALQRAGASPERLSPTAQAQVISWLAEADAAQREAMERAEAGRRELSDTIVELEGTRVVSGRLAKAYGS
ncbi:hypothetical protein [Chitinimonas lacunae]|uniref:Flagellar protein FliT n=1 Tax=Chitinimonas lacunae TaxID=1963018 RepID=A0ABV8MV09_9NEIS